jgi:tight adherence protein C
MESMNPLLHLILNIRLGLERGESLRIVLRDYLARHQTELTPELRDWVLHVEQGRPLQQELRAWHSPHRRSLLSILQRGSKGEAILPALTLIEAEVFEACEEELEKRAALLPLKCLVPLLLLQFPALLILILGPLLAELMKSL